MISRTASAAWWRRAAGFVDVMFDPAALPDLLSELLVSDEANKRTVSVQVVQRTSNGIVPRDIATRRWTPCHAALPC